MSTYFTMKTQLLTYIPTFALLLCSSFWLATFGQSPMIECNDITVELDANGVGSIDLNQLGQSLLTIEVLTDNFPEETSIALVDGSNNTVFEQAQGSFNQDATLFTFDVILDCDEDYTFTIFDAFGDGICCGLFGDGNYSLLLDGVEFASGGDFNASESVSFSTDFCFVTTLEDFIPDIQYVSGPSDFTCADLGQNISVSFSAMDDQGNTSNCSSTVTVVDLLPPIAICQDITVNLDANGSAQITPPEIDDGSSDNCATVSLSLDNSTFTCANVGDQTVVLMVDASDNTSATCSATVSVMDNIPPIALCQDLTIELNELGLASISPADIDMGSSDNCEISSSLNLNTFDCNTVGDNVVTLSIEDEGNNIATCSATVTIIDNQGPLIECLNGELPLDENGMLNIDLNNLGPSTLAIEVLTDEFPEETSLQVADGDNNIIFTQGSFNQLSTLFTFDVPLECDEDYTFTIFDSFGDGICCGLFGNGNYSLLLNGVEFASGGDFNASESVSFSTAVCLVNPLEDCLPDLQLISGQNAFSCVDIGQSFPLTVMATDGSGNTSECTANVIIVDETPPIAICNDLTINLDAQGNAAITPEEVDDGSNDACGSPSLSLDTSNFLCEDIGNNVVILLVNDESNNSATCSATITVEDNIPPVAVCRDRTVELDEMDNLTLDPLFVDDNSSDNCDITTALDMADFDDMDLGDNTVTLTVTDDGGNTSTCTAIITVVDDAPPLLNCEDLTVSLDENGMASIDLDDLVPSRLTIEVLTDNFPEETSIELVDGANNTVFEQTQGSFNQDATLFTFDVNLNCGEDYTFTIFDAFGDGICCGLFGDGNYSLLLDGVEFASGGDFNASESVAFSLDPCPVIAIDNCNIDFQLISGETDFTCTDIGQSFPMVIAATDCSNNTDQCNFDIIVADELPPIAVCQDITLVLDVSNSASITPADVDDGSSDVCGTVTLSLDINSFGCGEVGNNTAILTASDESNNTATCSATITIQDNDPPIAICQDLTIELDNTGNAAITPAEVDMGSSDNCGAVNLEQVNPSNFDCASIGANTATLMVNDGNGNQSTCTAGITVEDNQIPEAICQDLTIALDANGMASINLDDLSPSTLTIEVLTDEFPEETSIQVVDGNNNTVFVQSNFNQLSTLFTFDVTLDCDADYTFTIFDSFGDGICCGLFGNGNYSLLLDGQEIASGGDFNASESHSFSTEPCSISASDNCDLSYQLVSGSTDFTCSDIGQPIPLVVSATDGGGNSDQCTINVTVIDESPPTAMCQDVTIALDDTGMIDISPEIVDDGSLELCSQPLSYELMPFNYSCSQVGTQTSTLTVTDASGNSATCSAQITIQDNTLPEALCQDVTLQLDANGNASLTANEVDNGSNDACGIANLEVSPTAWNCNDVTNIATLTVTDNNSNQSTCTATISLDDSTPPIAICQDVTLQLDANGNATLAAADVNDGSNDACGIANLEVNPTAWACTNATNIATLTVTDNSNNAASCTATITVEDNIPPMALCQDVTLQLDANGMATLTENDINNGSNDACGIASLSVSPTDWGCTNLVNIGTLIVTDNNGNSSSCDATITVEDNVAPEALCQDVTLQLDANGSATLAPNEVDNGSSDACGIANLSVSPTLWSCTNAGNIASLTVTDVNGNSSSCDAVITVEDNVAPEALCQDVTLQLDANGSAALMANQIDNGSNDACGIANLSVDPSAWACTNASNTGNLTVTDNNGNASTCSATVTIQDNIAPVALCQNVTLQLDANGDATLSANEVDNGSNDACGIANLAVDPVAWNCNDVQNTATLTATDNNGNQSTCTATITLEDSTLPVALCQDVTLQLDANGNASLMANQVDDGSNDACGIANLSVNPILWGCTNPTNTATLTVTDNSGNTSTCTATISVEDNIPPVALCLDITVELDASGNGSLTANDIDNGSNDACGIQSTTASPQSFTCAEVGAVSVFLTVTDNNGNISSCLSKVVVEDNIKPSISCPADVSLDSDPGQCGTQVTIPVATATDNCGVVWLKARVREVDANGDPLSTWSSFQNDQSGFYAAGRYQVQWRAKDAADNRKNCSFFVEINDTEGPDAVCLNPTVILNGESDIDLLPEELWDAFLSTDNCSTVNFVSADMPSLSCELLGLTIPVTVTLADDSGNTSPCVSNVTLAGLPCGWSTDPNGIGGCDNAANFDSNSGTFNVTSESCFDPNFYRPNDTHGYVINTLCGNGEIIAHVAGISGAAWAGISLRENLAPDAKMIQLMVNNAGLARRELRLSTGSTAFAHLFQNQGQFWLRLTRNGNQFGAYLSQDGNNWNLVLLVNIPMTDCIHAGLITMNETATGPATAFFDNVSIIPPGNNLQKPPAGLDIETYQAPDKGFELYPNPASNEIYANLHGFIGQEAHLNVYNNLGQPIQTIYYEEIQLPSQRLDLRALSPGTYFLEVTSGTYRGVKKFVVLGL